MDLNNKKEEALLYVVTSDQLLMQKHNQNNQINHNNNSQSQNINQQPETNKPQQYIAKPPASECSSFVSVNATVNAKGSNRKLKCFFWLLIGTSLLAAPAVVFTILVSIFITKGSRK
jgi:hypothetical protein